MCKNCYTDSCDSSMFHIRDLAKTVANGTVAERKTVGQAIVQLLNARGTEFDARQLAADLNLGPDDIKSHSGLRPWRGRILLPDGKIAWAVTVIATDIVAATYLVSEAIRSVGPVNGEARLSIIKQ